MSGLGLLDCDLPSFTSLKWGGREIEIGLNISIKLLESNAILSVYMVENDSIKLCTIKLWEHFSRSVNSVSYRVRVKGKKQCVSYFPDTVGFDSKSAIMFLRVDNSLRSFKCMKKIKHIKTSDWDFVSPLIAFIISLLVGCFRGIYRNKSCGAE